MNRKGRSKSAESLKTQYESAKRALLLFGNDISAEDVVAAIKAESRRQMEAGDHGRRMTRIDKKG
jgi:hypothetical protein